VVLIVKKVNVKKTKKKKPVVSKPKKVVKKKVQVKKPIVSKPKKVAKKKVQVKKPLKKPVKKPAVKKEKKVKVVKKPVKKEEKFDVSVHYLVPKHTKLSEKEKNDVLETYKISLNDLPHIFMDDPAIAHLKLTTEDIIKIERPSETTEISIFYRRVI